MLQRYNTSPHQQLPQQPLVFETSKLSSESLGTLIPNLNHYWCMAWSSTSHRISHIMHHSLSTLHGHYNPVSQFPCLTPIRSNRALSPPHVNGIGSHSSNPRKHQHRYNLYPCTYIYYASHLQTPLLHGHQPPDTATHLNSPRVLPTLTDLLVHIHTNRPLAQSQVQFTHAYHMHGLASRPLQAVHLLSGLG